MLIVCMIAFTCNNSYNKNCNKNNEISGFDEKEEIDELDYYFKSNLRA